LYEVDSPLKLRYGRFA
jgi:dCMP deaminase